MAEIVTEAELGERYRTFLPSVEEKKGLLLSHLLGLALFSEFALNIFKFSLPLTPASSIPIRLLVVWLLIDRTGRTGRFRLGIWDAIILGFVLLSALGCVITAATYPSVPVSFEDFRRFVGLFLNAYLYYLVAREAINRRGFRPDITVKWLIAALTWSALVGIMQTLNLFHARSWSLIYANAALTFMREGSVPGDEGSSFASGTAAWWNSMALEMLVAFALVFGPTFIRKPKWYEWALGMLFMAAFIATQSRGGLVAFAACAVATFFWFFCHRKFAVATIIGATVTTGVLIWVFVVFALKIEKFTVTLKGETVRGSEYNQSIDSRFQQQKQLFEIGMKQPLFGIGPNFGYSEVEVWSPYSINGATDTTYGVVFAQFGIVGLVFLFAVVAYLVSLIRGSTAYRPYAFAAYFIGVAFAVHGIVEFLVYSRTFIVMNLLAAYAGSPYLVTEEGRAAFKRLVKTNRPAIPTVSIPEV